MTIRPSAFAAVLATLAAAVLGSGSAMAQPPSMDVSGVAVGIARFGCAAYEAVSADHPTPGIPRTAGAADDHGTTSTLGPQVPDVIQRMVRHCLERNRHLPVLPAIEAGAARWARIGIPGPEAIVRPQAWLLAAVVAAVSLAGARRRAARVRRRDWVGRGPRRPRRALVG